MTTATILSFDQRTGQLGQRAIEDAPLEAEDRQLWSVTTIIGALDKPALMYWSAEQAALAAINQQATWRGMLEDDDPQCTHGSAKVCAAVKWLRDARFRRPKGLRSATERGTLVHDAAEEYALTGTKPSVEPDIQPYLDSFDRWLQRFGPTYHATEVAVYHPEYGYAGTADTFLDIDGVRYIADYKTNDTAVDADGKPTTPYPEQVGLQLAAYRWAKYAAIWRPRRAEKFRRRYYLLSPAEMALAVPVPQVDTGLVIHITPESCEAYPIRCDEDVFDAYLDVQGSARWLYQTSKSVMSAPLVATGGAR